MQLFLNSFCQNEYNPNQNMKTLTVFIAPDFTFVNSFSYKKTDGIKMLCNYI